MAGEPHTASASASERSPTEAVGGRLRALRMARGWSMRELARRAQVSQPFVSKLEGGQILPSVPTLYTLAEVFGTTPSALLPSLQEPEGEHLLIPLADGEGARPVEIVAGGDGAGLQIYEFKLSAGEGDNGFFEHGGEEVVYVVEGEVFAMNQNREERLLEAGDSLRIEPTLPHCWRAGQGGAHFLLITSHLPSP